MGEIMNNFGIGLEELKSIFEEGAKQAGSKSTKKTVTIKVKTDGVDAVTKEMQALNEEVGKFQNFNQVQRNQIKFFGSQEKVIKQLKKSWEEYHAAVAKGDINKDGSISDKVNKYDLKSVKDIRSNLIHMASIAELSLGDQYSAIADNISKELKGAIKNLYKDSAYSNYSAAPEKIKPLYDWLLKVKDAAEKAGVSLEDALNNSGIDKLKEFKLDYKEISKVAEGMEKVSKTAEKVKKDVSDADIFSTEKAESRINSLNEKLDKFYNRMYKNGEETGVEFSEKQLKNIIEMFYELEMISKKSGKTINENFETMFGRLGAHAGEDIDILKQLMQSGEKAAKERYSRNYRLWKAQAESSQKDSKDNKPQKTKNKQTVKSSTRTTAAGVTYTSTTSEGESTTTGGSGVSGASARQVTQIGENAKSAKTDVDNLGDSVERAGRSSSALDGTIKKEKEIAEEARKASDAMEEQRQQQEEPVKPAQDKPKETAKPAQSSTGEKSKTKAINEEADAQARLNEEMAKKPEAPKETVPKTLKEQYEEVLQVIDALEKRQKDIMDMHESDENNAYKKVLNNEEAAKANEVEYGKNTLSTLDDYKRVIGDAVKKEGLDSDKAIAYWGRARELFGDKQLRSLKGKSGKDVTEYAISRYEELKQIGNKNFDELNKELNNINLQLIKKREEAEQLKKQLGIQEPVSSKTSQPKQTKKTPKQSEQPKQSEEQSWKTGLNEKEISAVEAYIKRMKSLQKEAYNEAEALQQALDKLNKIKTGDIGNIMETATSADAPTSKMVEIMTGMPVNNKTAREAALKSINPDEYAKIIQQQGEAAKDELDKQEKVVKGKWQEVAEAMIGGDILANEKSIAKAGFVKEFKKYGETAKDAIDELNKQWLTGNVDTEKFSGKYAKQYIDALNAAKEAAEQKRKSAVGDADVDSLFTDGGTTALTKERVDALHAEAAAYDELIAKKREYYGIVDQKKENRMGDNIIRSQEEIQTEIEETNRVIKNQEEWLRYLGNPDAEVTSTGKRDATDKLRRATNSLANYRMYPDEYYGQMDKEKIIVNWWKTMQEAQRQGVADSVLSRYGTDIGKSDYEESLTSLQKSLATHISILQDEKNRLVQLQAELQQAIQSGQGESPISLSDDESSDIGLTYDQLLEKIKLENQEIEKGNRQFKERLVILDDQNKIVASHWGDNEKVRSFTQEELNGINGKTLFHTHQNRGMYSLSDFMSFEKMGMDDEILHFKDSFLKFNVGSLNDEAKNTFYEIIESVQKQILSYYSSDGLKIDPDKIDISSTMSREIFEKIGKMFGVQIETSGDFANQMSQSLSDFERKVIDKIVSDLSSSGFDTFKADDIIKNAFNIDPNQININTASTDQLVERFKILRDEVNRNFDQTCELYEIYTKLGGLDIAPFETGKLDFVTDEDLKRLANSNQTPVSHGDDIDQSIVKYEELYEIIKKIATQNLTSFTTYSDSLSKIFASQFDQINDGAESSIDLVNRLFNLGKGINQQTITTNKLSLKGESKEQVTRTIDASQKLQKIKSDLFNLTPGQNFENVLKQVCDIFGVEIPQNADIAGKAVNEAFEKSSEEVRKLFDQLNLPENELKVLQETLDNKWSVENLQKYVELLNELKYGDVSRIISGIKDEEVDDNFIKNIIGHRPYFDDAFNNEDYLDHLSSAIYRYQEKFKTNQSLDSIPETHPEEFEREAEAAARDREEVEKLNDAKKESAETRTDTPDVEREGEAYREAAENAEKFADAKKEEQSAETSKLAEETKKFVKESQKVFKEFGISDPLSDAPIEWQQHLNMISNEGKSADKVLQHLRETLENLAKEKLNIDVKPTKPVDGERYLNQSGFIDEDTFGYTIRKGFGQTERVRHSLDQDGNEQWRVSWNTNFELVEKEILKVDSTILRLQNDLENATASGKPTDGIVKQLEYYADYYNELIEELNRYYEKAEYAPDSYQVQDFNSRRKKQSQLTSAQIQAINETRYDRDWQAAIKENQKIEKQKQKDIETTNALIIKQQGNLDNLKKKYVDNAGVDLAEQDIEKLEAQYKKVKDLLDKIRGRKTTDTEKAEINTELKEYQRLAQQAIKNQKTSMQLEADRPDVARERLKSDIQQLLNEMKQSAADTTKQKQELEKILKQLGDEYDPNVHTSDWLKQRSQDYKSIKQQNRGIQNEYKQEEKDVNRYAELMMKKAVETNLSGNEQDELNKLIEKYEILNNKKKQGLEISSTEEEMLKRASKAREDADNERIRLQQELQRSVEEYDYQQLYKQRADDQAKTKESYDKQIAAIKELNDAKSAMNDLQAQKQSDPGIVQTQLWTDAVERLKKAFVEATTARKMLAALHTQGDITDEQLKESEEMYKRASKGSAESQNNLRKAKLKADAAIDKEQKKANDEYLKEQVSEIEKYTKELNDAYTNMNKQEAKRIAAGDNGDAVARTNEYREAIIRLTEAIDKEYEVRQRLEGLKGILDDSTYNALAKGLDTAAPSSKSQDDIMRAGAKAIENEISEYMKVFKEAENLQTQLNNTLADQTRGKATEQDVVNLREKVEQARQAADEAAASIAKLLKDGEGIINPSRVNKLTQDAIKAYDKAYIGSDASNKRMHRAVDYENSKQTKGTLDEYNEARATYQKLYQKSELDNKALSTDEIKQMEGALSRIVDIENNWNEAKSKNVSLTEKQAKAHDDILKGKQNGAEYTKQELEDNAAQQSVLEKYNKLRSKITKMYDQKEWRANKDKWADTVADLEKQLGQIDVSAVNSEKYQEAMKDLEKIAQLQQEIQKSSDWQPVAKDWQAKSLADVAKWMDQNKNAAKEFREELERLKEDISEVGSKGMAEDWSARFQDIQRRAAEGGFLGKSLGDRFKDQFKNTMTSLATYYLSFQDFIRYGREAINIIVELDTAMTNLKKVADDSAASFDRFRNTAFDIAKETGSTATGVIDAATEWARLGYSLEDSAKLSKASVIYSNVGEIDTTQATTDLVSVLKAFKMDSEDALHAVDVLNEIGIYKIIPM